MRIHVNNCQAKDCTNPKPYRLGYCTVHYQRLRKHGDINRVDQIKVSHGMTKTPTWYSWVGMIERTTSNKYKQYADYKGRGITVCDRWQSFTNFYADMGERPPKMTLDRIDNDKGYSPDNCRWSDYRTQRMNQRRMTHV